MVLSQVPDADHRHPQPSHGFSLKAYGHESKARTSNLEQSESGRPARRIACVTTLDFPASRPARERRQAAGQFHVQRVPAPVRDRRARRGRTRTARGRRSGRESCAGPVRRRTAPRCRSARRDRTPAGRAHVRCRPTPCARSACASASVRNVRHRDRSRANVCRRNGRACATAAGSARRGRSRVGSSRGVRCPSPGCRASVAPPAPHDDRFGHAVDRPAGGLDHEPGREQRGDEPGGRPVEAGRFGARRVRLRSCRCGGRRGRRARARRA